MPTTTIPVLCECGNKRKYASGLCGTCYERQRLGAIRPRQKTNGSSLRWMIDRLQMGKLEGLSSDCIEWTGSCIAAGYGKFTLSGKHWRAHRYALMVWDNLDAPPRLLRALHSCDNPPCVNPEHLRWGTAADNTQDMYDRGRARPFERMP